MLIRKYKESDVESIVKLGKNLHKNYRFDLDVFSSCLVCEIDKRVIGFITYSIIYERAEIVDAYVDEPYRRKGYASKILEKIIEECKKNKCVNITLEVNIYNQPALDFYYKYDFKIVSRIKHYYNDDGVGADAYGMELELV